MRVLDRVRSTFYGIRMRYFTAGEPGCDRPFQARLIATFFWTEVHFRFGCVSPVWTSDHGSL